MVRRWIYYLASLIGCFIFYAAYQGWLAWLLLCCLFWLPLVSLAASLPAMLTAAMSCRCGGNMARGGIQRAEISVSCPWPMPHYRCRITVERPLTGEKWVLKEGQNLPADHVGTLFCRLEKCRVYDYLGLFFLRVRHRKDSVVTVRPEPVALQEPGDLQRFLSRAWKPKPGGGYAENHELRLYRPGDSLNQVHWKLSAKTGKLILREAMEPVREPVLLTMTLRGTPEELDRKLGRLLWLSRKLIHKNIPCDLRVLTAEGILFFPITDDAALNKTVDRLLCSGIVKEGSIRDHSFAASRQYHIGGDADET